MCDYPACPSCPSCPACLLHAASCLVHIHPAAASSNFPGPETPGQAGGAGGAGGLEAWRSDGTRRRSHEPGIARPARFMSYALRGTFADGGARPHCAEPAALALPLTARCRRAVKGDTRGVKAPRLHWVPREREAHSVQASEAAGLDPRLPGRSHSKACLASPGPNS